VLSELAMRVVVIAPDGCLFERPVHSLDLTVGPRMVGLGEAMIDVVLAADTIEHVQPVASGRAGSMLNAVTELDAIIGEDGVYPVGDSLYQRCEEVGCSLHIGGRVELGKGKPRCAIDRHEEVEFALAGANLGDIDVKVADRVAFEGLSGGLVAGDLRQPADAVTLEASMEQRLAAARAPEPWHMIRATRDGRTISVLHQPLAGGGSLSTHEDITARRQAEAQIAHMAHYDALADLPNWVLFREHLVKALESVDRDRLAVVCIDLDRFKVVNDTLGHPIGDALLRAVGDRLQASARPTDLVARFGGDEFAIVQAGTEQPFGATALAPRLISEIAKPFELDGHQVVIGASVGISIAPNDGSDPDRLLKNADMALYRAKSDGRDSCRFFQPDMDAKMQARRTMEIDLRRALALGEFEVYYQPLIALKTEKISCFEALLRWHHPERGMVLPTEFIPVAEEIGLIGQIGAWVLKRACLEAAKWPDDIHIAVNLSPAQFRHRAVVLDVVAALGASGLPPRRLEVEITEAVLLQDTESNIGILDELRNLGVRISMDDFGTGYSSLAYLQKFPFDKIKIDRSFVNGLDRPESIAIIRAVTSLGSGLGMKTTAEGVETEKQLQTLKDEGCTEVQGYLFSKAVPATEAAQLLQGLKATKAVA
jgi:diguanylate cyclase (GGDEF)-like protein